jgi:hypothetical protein
MARQYVELDPRQSRAVKTTFGRLHAWHRNRELPVYAELMDNAAQRMGRGLRRDDVVWLMRTTNERWQATSTQLAHEMAPVLTTLTPEQLREMEEKLARDNAKFAKKHVNNVQKANRERTEWLTEQVTRWIGELTPSQQDRIAAVTVATQDYPAARLAERRRRQGNFLHLVRDTHDPSSLSGALSDMLVAPRDGAAEAYKHSVAQYEEQVIQMVMDLDRSLTTEQRATAVDRLHRYAQAFRALSARS